MDELVEAWHRERADLDLAPVEVFSRVGRLARLLDKARREAFTAHRIETWEFDVLAALRRAGQALPAHAGRAAAPDDGHQRHHDQPGRPAGRARLRRALPRPAATGAACWSRLTAAGKRTVDGAFESLLASERDLLADLSDEDHAQLAALLKRLMVPLS